MCGRGVYVENDFPHSRSIALTKGTTQKCNLQSVTRTQQYEHSSPWPKKKKWGNKAKCRWRVLCLISANATTQLLN